VGALLLHLPYLPDICCTSTSTHQSDSESNSDRVFLLLLKRLFCLWGAVLPPHMLALLPQPLKDLLQWHIKTNHDHLVRYGPT
jgi:hypothetical protein